MYEERLERAYGFYRPYLRSVIYRYLDCGILRNGFARVRCGECGHEYLLAFVLKRSVNPALAGQASSLLSFLSPKAGGQVWRMGVRGGSKKGPPSSFCLQHPQDPSTLFPLQSFTPFEAESLCLGKPEGVFAGGVSQKGAVPGVFTAIQQKCLALAFKW